MKYTTIKIRYDTNTLIKRIIRLCRKNTRFKLSADSVVYMALKELFEREQKKQKRGKKWITNK